MVKKNRKIVYVIFEIECFVILIDFPYFRSVPIFGLPNIFPAPLNSIYGNVSGKKHHENSVN